MLLILTGPTCSGKTTVAKILEQDHDFSRLVTYTTRPKRENEVEGVDYYFVSEEEFRASMENNEFVEYRDYNALFGHVYYGSKVRHCLRPSWGKKGKGALPRWRYLHHLLRCSRIYLLSEVAGTGR